MQKNSVMLSGYNRMTSSIATGSSRHGPGWTRKWQKTVMPFAETAEPELTVDHAERSGDLDIVVTPGEKYVFGSILMNDTELFSADHAELIARFDAGDLYQQSEVQDLRRALIATGLVSTVTLEPVAAGEMRRASWTSQPASRRHRCAQYRGQSAMGRGKDCGRKLAGSIETYSRRKD